MQISPEFDSTMFVLNDFWQKCVFGECFAPSMLRMDAASRPIPSEIQISKIKLYPNEEFSTATLMISNVDSNCVHPRFQFRVYMWARVNISDEILKILKENSLLEIKLHDVSRCQMSPLVSSNNLGSLHACPGSFSGSLIFDDFCLISCVLR